MSVPHNINVRWRLYNPVSYIFPQYKYNAHFCAVVQSKISIILIKHIYEEQSCPFAIPIECDFAYTYMDNGNYSDHFHTHPSSDGYWLISEPMALWISPGSLSLDSRPAGNISVYCWRFLRSLTCILIAVFCRQCAVSVYGPGQRCGQRGHHAEHHQLPAQTAHHLPQAEAQQNLSARSERFELFKN